MTANDLINANREMANSLWLESQFPESPSKVCGLCVAFYVCLPVIFSHIELLEDLSRRLDLVKLAQDLAGAEAAAMAVPVHGKLK
jgi:hypothetical protein